MRWLTTLLVFVYLGNSEGSIIKNDFLQGLIEDAKDIITFLTPFPKDVSEDVFFFLFTKENPIKGQELFLNDVGGLLASFFNSESHIKFIIHGYLDDSNGTMAQPMKDRFLGQEKVNVILVDWGKITKRIDYGAVAKKTGDVGAYLAQFMDFLVENGASLDNFHLIGHSMGAHVAGFAGAGITNGMVSRITGLDPSLPGFNHASEENRLDSSNANFVDCIHTCAGILGLWEAICTADFYPNGGKNIQPGCPFYDFGQCSHDRSYDYFIESIDPEYQFPTLECDSVPTNAKNIQSCEASSVTMGYYTDLNTTGIYFSTTNKNKPFAPIHP